MLSSQHYNGQARLPRIAKPQTMRRVAHCTLVALLAACSAHAPRQSLPAQRIVSLMPSFTEDLCAIGARRQLVGVSRYSEDVACAAKLPIVSDFASVDTEKILQLQADVAVAIPAQRLLTAPLRRAGIPVRFFADDSYASIFTAITALGSISGRQREAAALNANLRARTRALTAMERFRRRPSVFFVAQAFPIWTAGRRSYISTLIDLAGGRNAVAQDTPYMQYSAEALTMLQPDAVVAGGDAGLTSVLHDAPWRSLRAVRLRHVYVLRDSDLLMRPGPRYNEGLSWLIERLRPLAE